MSGTGIEGITSWKGTMHISTVYTASKTCEVTDEVGYYSKKWNIK